MFFFNIGQRRFSTTFGLLLLTSFSLSFFLITSWMRTSQFSSEYGTRYQIQSQVLVDLNLFNYLLLNLRGSKYAGVDNYILYTVFKKDLRPLDRVQPILPNTGLVINDFNFFRYSINIDQCRFNMNDKTSIIIAVVSAPSNSEKRNTIRRTWKRHLSLGVVSNLIEVVGFAFFIGVTDDLNVQSAISQENRIYGDIVQIDLVDSYKNLTLKTVFLLDWVAAFCSKVDFVLKVDDDVYVNVRNLAATIRSVSPTVQGVYGRLIGGNAPPRSKSKWAYSLEMWPWSRLPKYIDGPAYLISGRAVVPLLAAAQVTPLFVSEDLYLSGLCSRKANVSLHSSINLLVHNFPITELDACLVEKTTAWVSDKYTVSLMNQSHLLMEQLYRGITTCVTNNKRPTVMKDADSSLNYVAASFNLVDKPDSV